MEFEPDRCASSSDVSYDWDVSRSLLGAFSDDNDRKPEFKAMSSGSGSISVAASYNGKEVSSEIRLDVQDMEDVSPPDTNNGGSTGY